MGTFEVVLDLLETILSKELGSLALHSAAHQDASLELSNTAFGQFLRFFFIPLD